MPDLCFPAVERPAVSIVMVTYNAADWARRALEALADHTPACYELIVVDNASSDGTRELLASELRQATLVLNDGNRGFGSANNQGAARAVGRHLLFLNNDALVGPDWLPPLIERIESHERIGAVGPRLLNLDGSLQIAGALLSRSGSTLELGYGEDADASAYRFPRIVDYLSGACLLVRRVAFDEVGGFDPAYELAYFEDADLCLSLAARGYRVAYEPRSSVTHVRGASPRGDLGSTLAPRNRSIFRRRWSTVLASRPLSPLQATARRLLAARDAPAPMLILVVGELPEPLLDTAFLARVTLIPARDLGAGAERLLRAGVEIASGVDDWCRWLEERRFHYDAVIAERPAAEIEAVVRRTQPQATWLSPGRLEELGPLDYVTAGHERS
jgi:GT2 family glycosyltransferase